MKIKLVIFDLDGTLIDAYKAIAESFNYTMRELSLPQQSFLAIKKAVGWGDEALLKPYVPPKIMFLALKIYRGHHKLSLLRVARLIPYTRKILLKLRKRKIMLAVASNRPTQFSLLILKKLEIRKYFDYILCADKLRFRKPHPQILNSIVRKLKVGKSQTLYVGDMAIDAETGRRAGIKAFIVLGGSSSRREIEIARPYKIIVNLCGFFKVIDAGPLQ